MASSRADAHDAGYATPAALVLSLAFATIGVSMVGNAARLVQLSKADLERSRFEHTMDGMHLVAAAAVVRSGQPGPFAWSPGSDLGPTLVTAESEAEKIDLATAAELDDTVFQALGVAQPMALRAALLREAEAQTPAHVADLDPAPNWRECAAAFISPFGQAERPRHVAPIEPDAANAPPAWHIGETWRVRVATTAGWRDDRIVRFTGDARHPAAIVTRRLSRTGSRGGECNEILDGLFGA